MPRLFISYRRCDSAAFAGRIYDRLRSRFGRDSVFMDIETIPLGIDFRKYLNEAVAQCDVLLAIIGEKWYGSDQNGKRQLDDPRDFVRIEIEAALSKGIPIVPILIGRVSMPTESELPSTLAELAYRNAISVDLGRDFHNNVDRLIRGLEHQFQGIKTVIRSALCSAAERRAYGIAAILLGKASVEGAVKAAITIDDEDEVTATLNAFQELLFEIRDRAGMLEEEKKFVANKKVRM